MGEKWTQYFMSWSADRPTKFYINGFRRPWWARGILYRLWYRWILRQQRWLERKALLRVAIAARMFWETVDAIPGMEDLSQRENGRVLYESLKEVEHLLC